MRERVVRALLRLGARIDTFRDGGNGEFVTPAGEAIFANNAPALSLCVRVGANLSFVSRMADSPQRALSGLALAIRDAWPTPLIYFLDKVYTARPVWLDEEELAALLVLASRGSPAKVCYEILEKRGFNFKVLEEIEFDRSDMEPVERVGVTSAADALLAYAQKKRVWRCSSLPREGTGLGVHSRKIEEFGGFRG